MATVSIMEDIFTPAIEKEFSKFPQEIISKIKDKINSDTSYLYYIWESQTFVHTQKMVMLYLSGVTNNWVTISDVSVNTGLLHISAQKTFKYLIKNNYISSKDFTPNIDWHTSFTFTITKKIIDEYLFNIIRNLKFLSNELNTNNHTQ